MRGNMDFRGVGVPGQTPINPAGIKPEQSSKPESASTEPKLQTEMERPYKPASSAANISRAKSSKLVVGSRGTPSKVVKDSSKEVTLSGIRFTENPILDNPKNPPELPPLPKISLEKANEKAALFSNPSTEKIPKKTLDKSKSIRLFQNLSSGLIDPLLPSKGTTDTHHKVTNDYFRQSAMALIETHSMGKAVDPNACLKLADKFTDLQRKDGTATTLMLRLYEVAAEIHENKGSIEESFKIRQMGTQVCKFNKEHDLYNPTKAIEGTKGTLYEKSGLHRPSGSQHVVGNLVLQTRPHIDGKARDELVCEISLVKREEFESRLSTIKDNLDRFNASLPSELGKVSFRVLPEPKKADQPLQEDNRGRFFQGRSKKGELSEDRKEGFPLPPSALFHEIEFTRKGTPIGKVTIGNSIDFDSLYTSMRVEVLANQGNGVGLQAMQGMLTVLGLGSVLGQPLVEDQARLKMGLIAEAYFPQVWNELQKDKGLYNLTAKDLEKKIVDILPDAQKADALQIFKRYENNPELIGEVEIVPGNKRLALNDFSTQMQAKGYIGCTSGVSSSFSAAGICELGFLSTEFRHRAGIVGMGESSMTDITTGGSRAVFVRLVNDKVIQEKFPDKEWKKARDEKGREMEGDFMHPETHEKVLDEYKDGASRMWQFSGKYQFIIAPEVVNGGGYGTYGDFFGVKGVHHDDYEVYKNRDNLIAFSEKVGEAKDKFSTKPEVKLNKEGIPVNPDGTVQKDEMKGTLNEVGIPGGCLSPKFFQGINCIDNLAKLQLIREFERKGMISDTKYEDGKIVDRTLNLAGGAIQVSLNDFLHVGNGLKKEMWEKKA